MHSIGNEYDDKKQALAICYGKWADKKAKASFVIGSNDNETIYVESRLMLPDSLIAKVKTFPQSVPGQYSVDITLKDGSVLAGFILDGTDFHSGENLDDIITDDIVDVKMNDTA